MPFYGHHVKEFMRREIAACRSTTPIDLLAARMQAHDANLLLVVDDDGYALGIVSYNDILIAQQRPEALVAGDIMEPPLATCWPDTPLREAVTRMYCHRVDQLLVIKPGEERLYPMGVICMSDVVLRLVQQAPTRGVGQRNRLYQS
jgi:CBS domain-containing protein